MSLSVSTELEAINTILATIGEAPVNTLEGEVTVDVSIARNTLEEVSREIQNLGWKFNTEHDYPLTPNSSEEIVVSGNMVRVRPNADAQVDPVQRGSRLYDRKNHTYRFEEQVKATVVFLLEFEELPESARRYITIRAARLYQDRRLGSDTLNSFSSRDEAIARAGMAREEAYVGKYNILSSPGVNRALRR